MVKSPKSLQEEKKRLLEYWKKKKVLKNESIVKAFKEVKREEFVLPGYASEAYCDWALPLIKKQTISQPTTVAIMTQLLNPKEGQKILEIGTGSGYQAAILSKIVGGKGKVCTIEIVPELYEYAKGKLVGFKNVKAFLGDGSEGLPQEGLFDGVIVTAGAKEVPLKLVKQLKVGGRMVIPIGTMEQKMILIKKTKEGIEKEDHGYFTFVPLVDEEEYKIIK